MPEHQRSTQLPNFLYARELRTSGIYSITCTANGLVYIGSAVNISGRWRSHYAKLDCGKHHNSKMCRSWAKYGPDAFVFAIVEHCPVADLIEREQYHIDACPPEICANLSPTAGSLLGFKQSAETCDKLRQRMLTFRHTPETLARISEAKKGIAPRPAGWKMPESAKEKISKLHTGRKHTDETKTKVSAASTGRLHSGDAKHKIRVSKAKFTPGQVAQIREEYLTTPLSINAMAKNWGVINWTISCVLRAVPPYDYNQPLEIKPKPATDDHRANLSAALKGKAKPKGFGEKLKGNRNQIRKHTPEHIAKAHEHMFGNQFTKGNTLTLEHKLKLSKATKGRPKSDATRERMHLAQIKRREEEAAKKRQPVEPMLPWNESQE